ncbi:MAG TPA: haloalkane dehalogenase [Rhizomicrobium sp.]|jgi:pimeloyl-ACP methyl ester carboxylesterase|nr:haloalkane dehalogenase [Rhizomicrobium sp.]
MTIVALRTPEDRFADVPDFPYAVRYVSDLPGYDGLRAAFVDEGPKDARHTFLCLHGEPSWSFLYRKMMPVFLRAGARVVAPDFLGFGRSDKPIEDAVYTFHFHRNYLLRLIERLDLKGITLVVQDWGGLLGLTLPVAPGMRARITRLLVMNTGIAAGEPAGPGFDAWRAFMATRPDLMVGILMKRGTPMLSDAEAAAYDAPFPDARYKAGVRRFPQLVMTEPGMEGVAESIAAREFWANEWAGQSFMAYGAADPVFAPEAMERLRAGICGCPPAMVVPEGGHFVQEWGGAIAEAAVRAFGL